MNRKKIADDIARNTNKVLENVDCKHNKKTNRLEFTTEQLNKFTYRIIQAVIEAYDYQIVQTKKRG